MPASSSEPGGGRRVTQDEEGGGLRARGEEALGDLAQALMDNPLFGQALTTALGAGERAAQAQRSAMGALNIPAASDLERLEQRLRSLSNRLEAVEDHLDEAMDQVAALRRQLRESQSRANAAPSVPVSEPDE
jgi:chromosome segregation ATPase